MQHKRPVLQDIANHLGITKMTVSRYLRDPKTVAPATREKIAAAIEQFGYIPNVASRIMSSAKSHAIGVLVPSLTNQVFADVIKGIESVTELSGYQTMLAHFGYSPEIEEQRIRSLLSYNVDALILSENVHSKQALKMLQVANIPIIEIMDLKHSKPVAQAVGFDNRLASQQMTETMIQQGRKNIVYFAARMDQRTLQKIEGYEKAMQQHRLQPYKLLTEQASSFSLGAQQLRQIISQRPNTDGILCTNDDLAIGAVFECQRQGIPISQRIAIAGFHGHNVGQAMTPQLASVITPRFEIGKIAAQEIIDRLNGITIAQEIIDTGFKIHLGESL
ncbi:substrate-binding domain-containing protein [Pasteurellaceae bacterium USgator11]|nr:substrate-binding domain-containing protein [Pasteurellaceae bacterium USgator41]TNG93427.1 substrate-binding domain-containing protein [Pasteurellaceae bacterium UScroc12]TNG96539.1 substrate-binding domain-containing protein [Pasteurellaceae bacterium UScroc31]TNG99611.1 substrate-binding domain-containing protein [Pasteurellaceae bacterium USgator11]